MTAFAAYRMPQTAECQLIIQRDGDPETVSCLADLRGKSGFVVAPFSASADCPMMVLRPDIIKTFSPSAPPRLEAMLADIAEPTESADEERRAYAQQFRLFHQQTANGIFRKIVLARQSVVSRPTRADEAIDLFAAACRRYPFMFVALVSAPACGTWLTATPELLLGTTPRGLSTMALAGTMPWPQQTPPPTWSEKNQSEQRLVQDFVAEKLRLARVHYIIEGPQTVRAGHLAHLCTRFHVTPSDPSQPADILALLHPTPAVSGMPQASARQFILDHERLPRRYYSGFAGPLALGGATSLYVNLRCMQIGRRACRLYAGGGLLADSQEQSEWDETAAKMQTMRQLL